jgi:hypothetical protein
MKRTQVLAVVCAFLLVAPTPYSLAEPLPMNQAATTQDQPLLSSGQLESLVAPIALYADPILGQVLVASTYPLEIVHAAQWLDQNASLSGKALADAAAKQPWEASVQALIMLPDLLKRLSTDIRWTSDLGDAFLAQQEGVMQAIQSMRRKAQEKGVLQSNSQQTVSTTMDNGQSYIMIEPAQTQVVYVPQYDPAAIWGPSSYPYPAIAYPPAGHLLSFGAGFALAAIWGGGGWGSWGWGCGWGRNNVVINNNFITRNNFNRVNVANGSNWVHNPAHRGSAAYTNRVVANRFQGRQANITQRPSAAQSERRLNQGNGGRGSAGQGVGNANRLGPGSPAQGAGRVGQRSPSQGSANRQAPSTGGSRIGQSNPSRGAANRVAPGFGSSNRGGGGGTRTPANSHRGGARGGGRRR